MRAIPVVALVTVTVTLIVPGTRGAVPNEREGRKKQDSGDTLKKIIPSLAVPFLMQTILLPLTLLAMKFILLKSMLLSKLGIFLWIINVIRNRINQDGGFYSHNVFIKDHPPGWKMRAR